MKLNSRVAVYGMLSPSEGGSVEMSNGKRGIVVGIDEEMGLTIFMDEPVTKDKYVEARLIDGIHPKQCRLLRKKQKSKKRNPIRQFFYTILVRLPSAGYRALETLLGRL